MSRKIVLVLMALMMARFCYADVTAEIIGKAIDDNGNIIIKTQYKVDGVEVKSRYPVENGKYCWITMYNVTHFANMTEQEISEKINKDISDFSKTLIRKKFIEVANKTVNLQNIIGQTSIETKAIIQISPELEWEVKTSGEKIEKVITPVPITQ